MQITLDLPDEVALRAQDAGLLTVEAVQKLLEEAMHRAAGRKLLSMAERLACRRHSANERSGTGRPDSQSAHRTKGPQCGWFLIRISSSRPWCGAACRTACCNSARPVKSILSRPRPGHGTGRCIGPLSSGAAHCGTGYVGNGLGHAVPVLHTIRNASERTRRDRG